MHARRCRCLVRRNMPWPRPWPNSVAEGVIPANEADDLYVTVTAKKDLAHHPFAAN